MEVSLVLQFTLVLCMAVTLESSNFIAKWQISGVIFVTLFFHLPRPVYLVHDTWSVKDPNKTFQLFSMTDMNMIMWYSSSCTFNPMDEIPLDIMQVMYERMISLIHQWLNAVLFKSIGLLTCLGHISKVKYTVL